MLINDADRVRITANTSAPLGPAVRLYRLLITKSRYVTFLFEGGFANHSTQVPASTLFYAPSARATGNVAPTLVNFTLRRAGTLRLLRVRATGNTLNGATTITILKNGVATGLTISLAAGALVAQDIVNTVAVVSADTISVSVSHCRKRREPRKSHLEFCQCACDWERLGVGSPRNECARSVGGSRFR